MNRQWLWRDLAIGALGGALLALMAQVVDATPCCGGLRTFVDLGRVPFGLILTIFFVVEVVRGGLALLRKQWRRAASLVLASCLTPALFLGFTAPVFFDLDYWRVRREAQSIEDQIRAREKSGADVFAQVYARDVSGGFVTAPLTFKRIVYDSSDEIAKEDAERSLGWKGRNGHIFVCEGHEGHAPRGRRLYGHFYVLYDDC